ncbi:CYCLIC NUCLEOTIDE-GATED ION CHANNEL 15-RELATED-RELATED [Salix purpurea]|uniref:CYCLIC NUCLEOTIDE-GATED ION CHANNEL 15-RELATED-RELATED n=1 Tax=Salix purpurea TaxID=77065 RepID=A0A9Q0Q0B3_SALPP|nr:CYCLIC NUCLEOTIDE-GATED ION CHANNEL 15-RELATED-RELATED [Salix purpurea]
MKFKKGKLVRFNDAQNLDKTLPVQKTSAPLFKTEGGHINSDRSTSNKVPKFGRFKVSPENNHEPYWIERILDPGSDVIFNLNRIFLFSCLTALFVDRLVFYLSSESNKENHLPFLRQLNVLSSDFLEKYLHGLWWGLQNLSSFGQSLSTSTFIGETAFSIRFSIFGLVLFAHLIGNMQIKYAIEILVLFLEFARGVDEEPILHAYLQIFIKASSVTNNWTLLDEFFFFLHLMPFVGA